MNKLAQYLEAKKVTQADFAREVGVEQATVSRLARGKMQPSLSAAVRIEKATLGEVPVADWTTDASDLPSKSPA